MRTSLFQSCSGINARRIHTPEGMQRLFPLIQQQADVHACTLSATPEAMLNALCARTSPAEAVTIENEHNQSVAYILYSHYLSAYGPALYLEDICVSNQWRGNHGFGQLSFAILAHIARSNRIDTLTWSVMASNARAVRFYNHFDAEFAQKDNMDLSTITADHTQDDYLHTSSHRHAPNSTVFQLIDTNGQIIATAIGNETLSSFRAVTGLQIEPLQISPYGSSIPTDEIYQRMHGAIAQYWQQNYASNSHLFAYGEQASFAAINGAEPLMMNDDRCSHLRTMQVQSHESSIQRLGL